MAGCSDILSISVGVIASVIVVWELRKLFRTPDSFIVTYLPTGRSVRYNTKGGPSESLKLRSLFAPEPLPDPTAENVQS